MTQSRPCSRKQWLRPRARHVKPGAGQLRGPLADAHHEVIQNQALWLNSSAAAGNQPPTARLAMLQASAALLNGTTIMLASRLTGVKRWKYCATSGIVPARLPATCQTAQQITTGRRSQRCQRGRNSDGRSGSGNRSSVPPRCARGVAPLWLAGPDAGAPTAGKPRRAPA